MKAKTKTQKRVMELVERLRPLSDKQKSYIQRNILDNYGNIRNGKFKCAECGSVSRVTKNIKYCPHCSKKIKLRDDRRWFTEWCYCTVFDVCEEFQVIRHFLVGKTTSFKVQNTITYDEIVQIWVNGGKEAIVARQRMMQWGSWSVRSDMEIRRRRRINYYGDPYEINGFYVSNPKILAEYRKKGVTIEALKSGICAPDKLFSLINCVEIETLLKTKNYDVIRHMVKVGKSKFKFLRQVYICNRHGYKIEDVSMWVDYLRLLEYFGKDIHNPYYICPTDLKKEHDKLSAKKLQKEEKEKLEAAIKRAIEYEDKYKEEKGKYFGISFDDGEIFISVIPSVSLIAEEGTQMHHCVFALNYFEKENSLILSAKDKLGNRIETIEINLDTFNVIQSRGRFNKNTEFHDKIIKLCDKNMSKIKKAKRA